MSGLLEAKFVVVDDDGDLMTVAFADDQFEPKHYVQLQKARVCDDQDLSLGMDKAHIEVNDQLFSGYGTVAGVAMRGREVRISLTPKGHKVLRTEGELTVSLDGAEVDLEKVRATLSRIAEGEFPFEVTD